MQHRLRRAAFTLIELLVVIAIIAIMASVLMPSLTVANDRANTSLCQGRLEHVGLALKQFLEENERFPKSLDVLYKERYLDDDSVLMCSKTGKRFFYKQPKGKWNRKQLMCSCVAPDAEACPHGHGKARVELLASGRVQVARR